MQQQLHNGCSSSSSMLRQRRSVAGRGPSMAIPTFGAPCPQRRRPSRCVALATAKDLWIKTSNKSTLLAALEGGVRTAVFEDPELAEACRPLATYTQLLQHGGPGAPPGQQVILDRQSDEEVARVCRVESAADLHSMEALVRGAAEAGGETTLVMDATDWKVIPAENLVALVQQASSQTKLMAVASSAQDALTLLGALQVGVHGVILDTESDAEVRALLAGLHELDSERVALQPALVTRVEPIGLGDRVCVDMTSMLRPGEGLLVGSFARGLFLVHCECAVTDFIASRPFRVNAGAVHSYVMGPGERTSYLSELRAASSCLVVAADGQARAARVGRCKLETRPMVLVEAKTMCGAVHSVVLQNAETVKLVCSQEGAPLHASSTSSASSAGSRSDSESEGRSSGGAGDRDAAAAAADGAKPSAAWAAVSVSDLQPGKHSVLVHVPSAGPARHTGLPVEEWVVEH